jgi:hypothetical protein
MTRVHIQTLAFRATGCAKVGAAGQPLVRSDSTAMDAFEEREKEFEARFKHDQELQFKVKARRNRMLGLWAAQKMGLTGDAADRYAREVVDAEFDGGDKNVVAKVAGDLTAKGQSTTEAQVKFQLDHLETAAKQQIIKE